MPSRHLCVALAALLVSLLAHGQDRIRNVRVVDEPRTKLEHFGVRRGAVVVTMSSSAGSLNAAAERVIYVETRAMTDTSTGEKQGGIALQVWEPGGSAGESQALIDAEEVEQLLKAIDYIAAIEKGVTKLANFRADFRTHGDLELSAYSTTEGQVAISLSTGRIAIGGTPGAVAQLDFKDLPKLRRIVATAYAALRTMPAP